jgi:hypothetical protein
MSDQATNPPINLVEEEDVAEERESKRRGRSGHSIKEHFQVAAAVRAAAVRPAQGMLLPRVV